VRLCKIAHAWRRGAAIKIEIKPKSGVAGQHSLEMQDIERHSLCGRGVVFRDIAAQTINTFLFRRREMTMDMNMLLFEFALLVIVGIVLVGIFRRS
jgi:hypothetical protein